MNLESIPRAHVALVAHVGALEVCGSIDLGAQACDACSRYHKTQRHTEQGMSSNHYHVIKNYTTNRPVARAMPTTSSPTGEAPLAGAPPLPTISPVEAKTFSPVGYRMS